MMTAANSRMAGGLLAAAVVSSLFLAGMAVGWMPTFRGDLGSGDPATGAAGSQFLNLTIRANGSNGLDQVTPANFSLAHGVRTILTITNFDTGVNPTASMWRYVMGTTSGGESIAYGNSGNSSVQSCVPASRISHTLTISFIGIAFNSSMMNRSYAGGMGGMNGTGFNGCSGMMGGGGMGGGMGSGMGSGNGGSMMGGGMMGGIYNRSWMVNPPAMFGIMFNLPIPAALNNSTPAIVSATIVLGSTGHYWWWCEAPCDTIAMATAGYMRGGISAT